jgi:hypothetical protein
MSVRVVSVASRCIILFPSPASTPSCQHQFGADQHSFGSPALSRCQPSLLSCQHFYYFMCSVPTASVCSFSQCAARVFTHTPLHCSAMSPLDATCVSSLWAGLHSISSRHPACSATYGLPPATATVICVCTCSPMLLCFGLRRVGLSR